MSKASLAAMAQILRMITVVAIIVFGLFYLILALASAAFLMFECESLMCLQLPESLLSGVGAMSLFVAAHRFAKRHSSVSLVVLVGTLPVFVLHVVTFFADLDESVVLLVTTAPPPATSGAALLYRVSGRGPLSPGRPRTS